MVSSAGRLWESLLGAIAKLERSSILELSTPDSASSSKVDAFCAAAELVEKARRMPQLHRAGWKKVISEMKVPQRLGAYCCGSLVLPSTAITHQHLIAAHAMSVFLTRADQDGICKVPSLSSTIMLQLHKSGFLDQLPSLLKTAADQLARVSLQDNPQQGTMTGSRLQPALTGAISVQAEMQFHAVSLLLSAQRIPNYLQHLDSMHAHKALEAAALQLAVAGLQHFSRCVELLQPDAVQSLNPTTGLGRLMIEAVLVMKSFLPVPGCQPTAAVPLRLLDASWYVQAACMYLALSMCPCPASVEQQQQQKAGPSSTSTRGHHGGGGGSSSSSSPGDKISPMLFSEADTAARWQFACSHHEQLPWPVLHMLHTLGCSSRAFTYASASYQLVLTHSPNDPFGPPQGAMAVEQAAIIAAAQAASQGPKQHDEDETVLSVISQMQQLQQLAFVALLHSAAQLQIRCSAVTPALDRVIASCQQLWRALGGLKPEHASLTDQIQQLLSKDVASCQQGQQQSVTSAGQQQEQQQLQLQQQQQQQSRAVGRQNADQGQAPVQSPAAVLGRVVLPEPLLVESLDSISTVLHKLLQHAQRCSEVCTPCSSSSSSSATGDGVGRHASGHGSGATSGSAGGSGCKTCKAMGQACVHEDQMMLPTMCKTLQVIQCLLHYSSMSRSSTHHSLHVAGSTTGGDAAGSSSSTATASSSTSPVLPAPVQASWHRHSARLLAAAEAAVCTTGMGGCPSLVSVAGTVLDVHCSYTTAKGGGKASEQEPLLGLAFTLLKGCQSLTGTPSLLGRGIQLSCLGSLCQAGLRVLSGLLCSETADSSCNSGPSSAPSSSKRPAFVLPWLVLLGRCCLVTAQQLRCPLQLSARGSCAQDNLQALGQLTRALCVTINWSLQSPSVPSLQPAADVCMQAVQAGDWFKSIAAAATAAAATAAAQSERDPGAADGATVTAMAGQLQELGLLLSTMAISTVCNNPFCSNMTGLSEQRLVKGSSRVCAGCRAARYCSKDCQKQHWKQHRPVCNAIATAKTASSTGTGSTAG